MKGRLQMKTDFDKELEKIMTEEKEIPEHVRKRLDSTYNMIQVQAKRKKNRSIWKRVAAAACALLIAATVLTNEQVRAGINDFFIFGDKGIERALFEGFSQENNSTDTDQNVSITLKRNFGDDNKIGMSFQLAFEDPSILGNGVTAVSMDYRIKNGDDVYIVEFIPDTKTLKGNGGYASGLADQNPIIGVKTGVVQYDVIVESNKGELPSLKDAVVEIESINIFREGNLQKIDGKWDLPVSNQEMNKPIIMYEYVTNDSSSLIQVTSARANPTSFNLKFTVNQVFEDDSPFVFTMKIIDEEGNEYEPDGFSIETRDNQTYISTNFPVTSYENADKLKFIIEKLGEVELLKK